jgi:hypothetical protein
VIPDTGFAAAAQRPRNRPLETSPNIEEAERGNQNTPFCTAK